MMPRLEERGLVKRESSLVDKRAVDVELTPSGRRTFQEMLPPALASSEAGLAVLPPEYRLIFRHSARPDNAVSTDLVVDDEILGRRRYY
jgi:DNA-binding MarR family transcriptional regulator